MTENENLEKQIKDYLIEVLKEAKDRGCIRVSYFRNIPLQNIETIINVLEEIQQYRAIGRVEEVKYLVDSYNDMMHDFGDNMLALEQYKAIGTVEEFKVLKEKNAAKKAEVNEFDYGEGYVCGECESFLHYVDDDDEHIRTNYCCHCGTKIDW